MTQATIPLGKVRKYQKKISLPYLIGDEDFELHNHEPYLIGDKDFKLLFRGKLLLESWVTTFLPD